MIATAETFHVDERLVGVGAVCQRRGEVRHQRGDTFARHTLQMPRRCCGVGESQPGQGRLSGWGAIE